MLMNIHNHLNMHTMNVYVLKVPTLTLFLNVVVPLIVRVWQDLSHIVCTLRNAVKSGCRLIKTKHYLLHVFWI